jgi:hopene-associated glycosyltransferase HpnB
VALLLALLAVPALLLAVPLWLDPARRWSSRTRLGPAGPSPPTDVVVVVPARNEAETLPRSLPTVAAWPEASAVLVVDDRSSDATASLARAVPGVQVLAAPPPPAGWMGKVNALATGVAARRPPPAWFLFTDADIAHPPDGLRRLLAEAERGPRDLVSVFARLRTQSAAERLLIPAFTWFFHLLYPFARVPDPRSRVAAAAGGCVLIRAELLQRLGGLAAISGAVIDDLALARRAKAAGGRCWLGHAAEVTSLRAYDGVGSVVDMVARSAFTELRYRTALVPLVAVVLLAGFTLPPLVAAAALATGHAAPAAMALLAWLLPALHLLPVVRHHRLGAAHALLLPLAAPVYAWATVRSAMDHHLKRQLRWRG